MSRLYFEGDAELLFTENETNAPRLWNYRRAPGYFKDGFHERIVGGRGDSVNPARTRHQGRRLVSVPPSIGGGKQVFRLRLSRRTVDQPFADFEDCLTQRRGEADEFYADLQKDIDLRGRARGAAPGLCRPDLEQAVLLLRCPALAQGRSRPADSAGSRACTAATATGATSTMPTSSPCRTSGSTPGTPPGIWRSTASLSP